MKSIVRKVQKAISNVNKEIEGNSVGKYGAGLASEGYAGGYRDALNDVLLALRGVNPNRRWYWGHFKE